MAAVHFSSRFLDSGERHASSFSVIVPPPVSGVASRWTAGDMIIVYSKRDSFPKMTPQVEEATDSREGNEVLQPSREPEDLLGFRNKKRNHEAGIVRNLRVLSAVCCNVVNRGWRLK